MTQKEGTSQKLMESECWVYRFDSTDAHQWSKSCFNFLFRESRRHNRWMNTAFQMLISNSCSRSTTSMGNILNSSGDSFSENAFWNKWTSTSTTYEKRYTYCHWDKRVVFEEPLYGHTVNHVVALIYSLTRSFKTTMLMHIINTCERHMLWQISMHFHVRNMILWNETLRTWAETKIANAHNNYSRMNLSLWYFSSNLVRTYFSL